MKCSCICCPSTYIAMEENVRFIKSVHLSDNGDLSNSVTMESNLHEVCLDTSSADETSESEIIIPASQTRKKIWPLQITYFTNLSNANQISLHPLIVLILLLLIYILNQADRLVLPVVIPAGLRCTLSSSKDCDNSSSNSSNSTSHKDCISFNDYEQGLITGPAFTVVYVLFGLPISRIADRWSRSITLLVGLTSWSAIVLLTGFVKTFWQLLLFRILLGIGEVSIWCTRNKNPFLISHHCYKNQLVLAVSVCRQSM